MEEVHAHAHAHVHVPALVGSLKLLGILPIAIANRDDVENEFCGSSESGFNWVTSESRSVASTH